MQSRNQSKLLKWWIGRPLIWKIISVLFVLTAIGLSTRSLAFAIIAWLVIIYFAAKIIMDLEVF